MYLYVCMYLSKLHEVKKCKLQFDILYNPNFGIKGKLNNCPTDVPIFV